jgi:hypothetical protein
MIWFEENIEGKYLIRGCPFGGMEFLKLDSLNREIQPPVYSLFQGTDDLAMSHPEVGPLSQYAINDTYIFTRHWTWKNFSGNKPSTPTEIDKSKEFYFLVRKSDAALDGPFEESGFLKHPATQNKALNWVTPPVKHKEGGGFSVSIAFLIGLWIVYWKIALGLLVLFAFMSVILVTLRRRRKSTVRK